MSSPRHSFHPRLTARLVENEYADDHRAWRAGKAAILADAVRATEVANALANHAGMLRDEKRASVPRQFYC